MKNLRDLEINDLKKLLEEMGEKPFRAKQIYTWLHQNLVEHYDEMTNISKGLRDRLSAEYSVALPETVEVLTSKIDGTKKFIFRMQDGHVIESVWMEYQHGHSVCISSQVGCRMGCKFCIDARRPRTESDERRDARTDLPDPAYDRCPGR